MKHKLLVALLLLCPAARADSIINLAGTLTGVPREIITYNLTIQTIVGSNAGGIFFDDILGGSTIITTTSGKLLSDIQYSNDSFVFGPGESLILAEYGIESNSNPSRLLVGYDFVANAKGISLVFHPENVATLEPTTIVLVVFGALWLWALSLKPRKGAQ